MQTLVFPGEKELIRAMYEQIREEEQVISPPYTRTPLDAFMRGQKKRKQGEDNALVGWPMQHGSMLRALVHDTFIGGLMIHQGRASNQWLYFHWSPLLVAYCALSDIIHSPWKEASNIQLQSWPFQNQWGSH